MLTAHQLTIGQISAQNNISDGCHPKIFSCPLSNMYCALCRVEWCIFCVLLLWCSCKRNGNIKFCAGPTYFMRVLAAFRFCYAHPISSCWCHILHGCMHASISDTHTHAHSHMTEKQISGSFGMSDRRWCLSYNTLLVDYGKIYICTTHFGHGLRLSFRSTVLSISVKRYSYISGAVCHVEIECLYYAVARNTSNVHFLETFTHSHSHIVSYSFNFCA